MSEPTGARVALLGGTFDPIHYGHLFAAEAVAQALALEQVLFVPAGSAPHKEPGAVSPARDRLAMVALALEGNPRFAVSDQELRREGKSYTIDTVIALEGRWGAPVTLILGVDAFLLIRTWMRWEELLRRVRLVLVSRPGYTDDDARRLAEELAVPIESWIEDLGVAVSSSALRARVAGGLPIRYLTPDAVIAYIADHGLYRAG